MLVLFLLVACFGLGAACPPVGAPADASTASTATVSTFWASKRASGTWAMPVEAEWSNSKRPISVPYFFCSFANFGSRVFHIQYSGQAMAMDE